MAHVPMRMCVACRQMQPVAELIRFAADKKSHTAVLDIHKRKFARGAYICCRQECIDAARKRNALQRHLGCKATKELYDLAEEMI